MSSFHGAGRFLSSSKPICGKDGGFMQRFHHEQFDAVGLVAAKRGRTVSVCLPALNEAATVGAIIDTIRTELIQGVPLVDEVVVVDDGSTDATAEVALAAGAKVVAADAIRPELGSRTGKGEAMWKGVLAATGDILAFCDADVRNFDAGFVLGLVGPLLTTEHIRFVKGFYDRPYEGEAGQGGRVTELVARPMLSLFFPVLAGFAQPLAGEYAAHREVFRSVPFVEGYGVDVALLVDICAGFGADAMAECDLGIRIHRNRPLAQLAPQADAIIRTLLVRSGIPLPDGAPAVLERPPASSV
jgi:glucosyl-3-phosphoglycerate synthase